MSRTFTRQHLNLLLDLSDVASALTIGSKVTRRYYCERIRPGVSFRQFDRLLRFARKRFPGSVELARDEDGESCLAATDLDRFRAEVELSFNRLERAAAKTPTGAAAKCAKRRAVSQGEGLCGDCGAPSPDRLTCDDCVRRSSERSVRRRAQLVRLGICGECSVERVEGDFQRCAHCRKKGRSYMKRLRARCRRGKTCPTCMKRPQLADASTCFECRQANRARAVSQERHAREKRLRDFRKANHLCVQCGVPAKKTMCRKHLRYHRLKQREYADARRRAS